MKYDVENVPIPAGRPNSLASTIRSLRVGQSFLIPNEDVKKNTQKGLYTIAANVGAAITTRTVEGGLRVWREPDKEVVVNQAEVVEDVGADEVSMSKNEKLDSLRDLMDLTSSGIKASEIYRDNTLGENDSIDEWRGWSEERTTVDQEAGETVYYRQHIKTGKRKEIRRETYYG